MTLTQELANLRQQFLANAPTETIEIMNQAISDLANSDLVDNSLKIGNTAPNFTLPESLRPIYENFGIDLPA